MQDVDENFGRVEQAIDTLNANASLLKAYTASVTLTNGAAVVLRTDLGVSDCTLWRWLATTVYLSGAQMVYPIVQSASDRVIVYLRYGTGQVPPDGTYRVNLLGIKI